MSPITLANCEGVTYFGKVYSRVQIPALVVLNRYHFINSGNIPDINAR
jgi:hypothetical protein